jgi:hypothetical protein
MVVSSLADDIVDSMHPIDTDGDGVVEDRGPLGTSGGDLEPFLPEEEREKRRKSAKRVRWAINVCGRNNGSPARALTPPDQRPRQHRPSHRKRHSSPLVQFPLAHRIARRLRP